MPNTRKPRTFLDLPHEVKLEIFDNVLSGENITVEPDENDPSQSCWRLPEQALKLARVSRDFWKLYPQCIENLTCKGDARPNNLAIPDMIRQGIRKITFAGHHDKYLDTAAFPNLRLIVCKVEYDSYIAAGLNRFGHSLAGNETTVRIIHQQQAEIHRQIRPQLPTWMQDLVLDPASQVELAIRVTLDFCPLEETALTNLYWNGSELVERIPEMDLIPLSVLYCWRAGRPYFAVYPSMRRKWEWDTDSDTDSDSDSDSN